MSLHFCIQYRASSTAIVVDIVISNQSLLTLFIKNIGKMSLLTMKEVGTLFFPCHIMTISTINIALKIVFQIVSW